MNSVYESSVKKGDTIEMSVVKHLEMQYDANHDFAIFSCGDATKGGIQTLAEKMNMAEVIEEEEEEHVSTNSKTASAPSRNPSVELPEN